MKLLFITVVGALFLFLTYSAQAAKLEGIDSSIETLYPLQKRQESLKGCSMSSLDKCYGTVPPDGSVPNDLLEEIGHISDAQTCQRFCNELYNGTCQWFMYDKTTKDCKLFSSSLNDLWNDCREVGYASEPDHELCDEMFQSDSINGCYNFREDYCRFEFSLLENLEEIDSLSDCQLACQYINNCSYFVYDSPSKICKLNTQLSQKTCDIIHGTPQPDLSTCISGGKLDWASKSTSTPTGGSNSSIATTERPETTTLAATTTTSPAQYLDLNTATVQLLRQYYGLKGENLIDRNFATGESNCAGTYSSTSPHVSIPGWLRVTLPEAKTVTGVQLTGCSVGPTAYGCAGTQLCQIKVDGNLCIDNIDLAASTKQYFACNIPVTGSVVELSHMTDGYVLMMAEMEIKGQ